MGDLEGKMDEINKRFGDRTIVFANTAPMRCAVIPTGVAAVDWAFGVGGVPRGRITVIWGPESGGKSTLTLHTIAECQRLGGKVALIDAEHRIWPDWARLIGVDLEAMALAQSTTLEEALECARMLAGSVDLIVLDSIIAAPTRAELDGEVGDAHVGIAARTISRGLKQLTGKLRVTETAFLVTNQLRFKIGGMVFGNPETMPGGVALKFHASIIAHLYQSKAKDSKETFDDGSMEATHRLHVEKNSVAPPWRNAVFKISSNCGIDTLASLVETASHLGVLTKRGGGPPATAQAALFWGDQELTAGNAKLGRDRATKALWENAELASAIREATYAAMTGVT